MKANERSNAPKYVQNKRREKFKDETSSESSNESTSVSSVEGYKSSKSHVQKGKQIQKKNHLSKMKINHQLLNFIIQIQIIMNSN